MKKILMICCGLLLSAVNCVAYKAENLIPRDILFGHEGVFKVQISPDGTRLAYLAPIDGILNVWIKTLGQSDDKPVTHVIARDIRNFFWGLDSKHIYYLQDDNGDENWNLYEIDLVTEKAENITPFPDAKIDYYYGLNASCPLKLLFTMNREDKRFFDLYQLDLITRKISLVEKNSGTIASWVVDREMQVRAYIEILDDCSHVVWARETVMAPWKKLLTWDFADARVSNVLAFTHDGMGLYFIDSSEANTGRLVRIDIQSGKKTVLASDNTYDMGSIFIHPISGEYIAYMINRERREIMLADERYRAHLNAIRALDSGDITFQNADADFNQLIIAFDKDNGPRSYYLYNVKTKQGTFICYDKPHLLDYTLASMEPVTLPARDGLLLHGYITHATHKPSDGSLPPLLLVVHGGPMARDSWGYDSEIQWLANRGITCLQINYRGSLGYGKDFVRACNKERGRKMLYDIIDGAEWAVKQGIADTKKMGIYGWSYGGYSALAAATFTPDVFCCAIDGCGVSNLLTFYESIPPYWAHYLNIMKIQVGDPAKELEMLKERSPLFKVDAIKIPIFIVQGAHDPRIKQSESEQIVAAMKAKNIPHVYMLFENEGHGLARADNNLLFYATLEKFLAEHLGSRYEDSITA